MRETVGSRIVRSLKRNDPAITYACIEVLNALMVPMHENYDLKQVRRVLWVTEIALHFMKYSQLSLRYYARLS